MAKTPTHVCSPVVGRKPNVFLPLTSPPLPTHLLKLLRLPSLLPIEWVVLKVLPNFVLHVEHHRVFLAVLVQLVILQGSREGRGSASGGGRHTKGSAPPLYHDAHPRRPLVCRQAHSVRHCIDLLSQLLDLRHEGVRAMGIVFWDLVC